MRQFDFRNPHYVVRLAQTPRDGNIGCCIHDDTFCALTNIFFHRIGGEKGEVSGNRHYLAGRVYSVQPKTQLRSLRKIYGFRRKTVPRKIVRGEYVVINDLEGWSTFAHNVLGQLGSKRARTDEYGIP